MSADWGYIPPLVEAPGNLPPGPTHPPVRVLHVLTKFEAGAGGNTLLSATGMDPARYEVWIVGSEGGPLWALAEQAGIRTAPLPNMGRELSPLADLRAGTGPRLERERAWRRRRRCFRPWRPGSAGLR